MLITAARIAPVHSDTWKIELPLCILKHKPWHIEVMGIGHNENDALQETTRHLQSLMRSKIAHQCAVRADINKRVEGGRTSNPSGVRWPSFSGESLSPPGR